MELWLGVVTFVAGSVLWRVASRERAIVAPWLPRLGIGIAVRHRDNIRRIRFGTEARIGDRRSAFPDSGYA